MPCQGCARRKKKIQIFLYKVFGGIMSHQPPAVTEKQTKEVVNNLTETDKIRFRQVYKQLSPELQKEFTKSFKGEMAGIVAGK